MLFRYRTSDARECRHTCYRSISQAFSRASLPLALSTRIRVECAVRDAFSRVLFLHPYLSSPSFLRSERGRERDRTVRTSAMLSSTSWRRVFSHFASSPSYHCLMPLLFATSPEQSSCSSASEKNALRKMLTLLAHIFLSSTPTALS